MASQGERRSATRGAIVDSAQRLFAIRGYEATSVADILEAAEVSRGAMYHHFASKEDLFAVVFVQTSSDAIRRASKRVSQSATAREALIDGCLGWLEAVDEPSVRRILLIDGPVALGWERARLLEEATSLGVMRSAIHRAVRDGELVVASIDLAARMINAMLTEAALNLRPRDVAGRRRSGKMLRAMIDGLAPTTTR